MSSYRKRKKKYTEKGEPERKSEANRKTEGGNMSWTHILLFTCASKILFRHLFNSFSTTYEYPNQSNLTIHEKDVQNAISGRGMRLMLLSEIYI